MARNLCFSIRLFSATNRHPLALAHHQQLRDSSAAGVKHWRLIPWRRRPGQSDAEHKLNELDDPFGIAMQQAKVSDPSESFWQHMEKQAPEELSSGETLDHLLPLVIFDAKGDDPIAIAKDILF
jgi:hypothetical protein